MFFRNKKFLIFFFIPLLFWFVSLVVYAATKVETKTETITLPDTDGDGILDKDDPHPDIPEIYIVQDKNLNGIVDQFEKN